MACALLWPMTRMRIAAECIDAVDLPRAPGRGSAIAALAEAGRFELTLWGRLGRSFAAHLCTGLAASHLSVVRGEAERCGEEWSARFELERRVGRVDPRTLDFLTLCREPRARRAVAPLELAAFSLGESAAHPGAMELRVEAADRLGLLGALLERLAFLAVAPEQMAIETRAGRALDRFRLRAADGSPLSRATQRILHEVLAGKLLC